MFHEREVEIPVDHPGGPSRWTNSMDQRGETTGGNIASAREFNAVTTLVRAQKLLKSM
jgi:hypothetical protein